MGDILEELQIFDTYKGDQIEKNKKSISFKLILRKQNATITDKEVEKKLDVLLKNLRKINIFLR